MKRQHAIAWIRHGWRIPAMPLIAIWAGMLTLRDVARAKWVAVLLLCAALAVAEPINLEWEPPTHLESGDPIPAELLPDMVTRIYAARQSTTNWAVVGEATNATQATVDLPVGAWLLRATAGFPGVEESEPSDVTGGKVYGRLRKVKKLWVLQVVK
jgi:hypothetical protein